MSKTPQTSSEGGAPEWMVSYADMITIVLAFFVVLYATTSGMGKSDRGHDNASTEAKREANSDQKSESQREMEEKLNKVIASLNERFGPSWTLSNCWAGGPVASKSRSDGKEDKYIRGFRGGQVGGNSVATLTVTKSSEYTVPGGRIFFGEFSADIDSSQIKELNLVSEDLAGKSQKIEIRGHASRRPLPKNSPYKNHWELAFARCVSVADYLSAHGVDSRRMRFSVSSDNEPSEAVIDPPFGERNSRVEIRFLNEWIADEAGQKGETSAKQPKSKEPSAAGQPSGEKKPGEKKSTEKSPAKKKPTDAAKESNIGL
jgi:chemotaxis protein MotB